MNNRLLKTGLALLTALLLHGSVHAQPLVLPLHTDDVLHNNGGVPIDGLNTASIDVPIGSPATTTGYGQLVACAYLDANGGGIVVKDMASGNVQTIPYPRVAGAPKMTGVPDVILGNIPTSVATTPKVVGQNFTMAVGYMGQIGIAGTPAVYVDYYTIDYSAWGGNNTFTVNHVQTQPMHLDYNYFTSIGCPIRCGAPPAALNNWKPLGTVHLDVVADPNATGFAVDTPYNTPRADHFFVTYDAWIDNYDCTPPFAHNGFDSWIFCAYGGYNNPSVPPVGNNGGLSAANVNVWQFIQNSDWGYQPDIAGVRYDTARCNTPACGSTTAVTLDMGILMYTNTITNPIAPLRNSLRSEQWFPAGMNPLPGGWGNGPTYFTPDREYDSDNDRSIIRFTHPRVDADDNNLTNNLLTTDAWKVVYESDTFGATNQSTVSNGAASFPAPTPVYNSDNIDLSSAGAAAPTGSNYNHYLPAVAYSGYQSPSGKNEYMMTTVTDAAGWGQALAMQPIEQTLPLGIAIDPSATNSYFLINSNYPADIASCSYANSVSTPCNAISDTSIIAWASRDTGATYKIFYKNNKYNTATPGGYEYKPSPTAVNEHKQQDAVRMYPNPADNTLTLIVPGRMLADNYTITNMLGQQAGTGSLAIGRNTLDISKLSPGSYILRLMSRNEESGSHVFVKK